MPILLTIGVQLAAAGELPPVPRVLSQAEAIASMAHIQPPPPTWRGKITTRSLPLVRHQAPPIQATPLPGFGDYHVDTGSEASLAINDVNPDNAVTCYNETINVLPASVLAMTANGNAVWRIVAFPNGAGTFTNFPYDPWVIAGNAPGEFYVSMIRTEINATNNIAHCLIAHSTDGGATFAPIYEENKPIFQDREMFDVDRSTERGGGPGTTYDGLIYLSYTAYPPSGASGDSHSLLNVIKPDGTLVRSIEISGPGTTQDPTPFRGADFQPLAGVTDGSLYLLSSAVNTTPTGAQAVSYFHEMTNAGSGASDFMRSAITYFPAGQNLGNSGYYGLNGHRIDPQGILAIDRSTGARHGWLFYIINDNPNPTNSALDQGDLHLAISSDDAHTWRQIAIPAAPGKTQFFPMLDVDGQGIIHVAYYQNESGNTNGGVYNASLVNVYYLRSDDGGQTWTAPRRVNAPEHTLTLPDPPTNLSSYSYYLLGDYQQIHATGSGANTRVYISWTGYDNTTATGPSTVSSARIYCTRLAAYNQVRSAWQYYE